MPPPQPKRFFRIRKKSDGSFFLQAKQRFEKRGSKLRERELLKTMQRLVQIQDVDDLEVIRFDVVPYPPRPLKDLLKRMEEAKQNQRPLS